MIEGIFYDCPPETDFPLIKHRRLARGDGSLRFVERNPQARPFNFHTTRLVGLAIANFGVAIKCICGRGAINPMRCTCRQALFEQQRMVSPLNHNKFIGREIFLNDIPGFFFLPCDATNTQPLSLADGVIHQAMMFAQGFAIRCFDQSGLSGEVLLQKILKAPLADKADACAVFFIVRD